LIEFDTKQIDDNKIIFDVKSYPEELGKFWTVVTKIEDHPLISYVASIYINDDFMPGTIIESSFFYHKYPDLHVVYDKDIFAIRIYTSPFHRGKKHWEYLALVLRNFFYSNLNIYTDISSDRTILAQNMYKTLRKNVIKDTDLTEEDDKTPYKIRNNLLEKEIPRDPCFPYTWYNHRMAEKINE
jgi:hypothetical protein